MSLQEYIKTLTDTGFATIEIRAKRPYRIYDVNESVEIAAIKDPMLEDGHGFLPAKMLNLSIYLRQNCKSHFFFKFITQSTYFYDVVDVVKKIKRIMKTCQWSLGYSRSMDKKIHSCKKIH